MTTRRRFVLSIGAIMAAGARAFALPFRRAKTVPSPIYPVYFGTDTLKGVAKGIYHAKFNAATGQLTQLSLAAGMVQPSFLALGPATARRMLYAVNEASDSSAAISTLEINPQSGELHALGQVSSGTPGPCFVAVDSTGHAAFVANYAGGSISSYHIEPSGVLSGPVEQVNYKDESRFGSNGPNVSRQDGPHPHSATISPDNRFLVVNDLGHDQISIFAIDPDTAKLTVNEPHLFSNNRPGSGPRHVAFHPNGRWVYGVNELDSSVDHYLWTATHGAHPQALLTLAGPPVKTIADDFPPAKSTAAEIAVSPNGSFVYASNRGEDSLVVFGVDADTGALRLVQRVACGGKTPRHFTLDPTGKWLLCANQSSGTVTVFRRDGSSGRLTGPIQTAAVPGPIFTLFG